MKKIIVGILVFNLFFLVTSCDNEKNKREVMKNISPAEILGNAKYPAISYGGYRTKSRNNQPTLKELKEDLLILHAMGIGVIRTYNVHLPHAENVLQAIDELVDEKENFEMYLMLGAWIDCKNAWTSFEPIHNEESERNETEIAHAVKLANQYPHIVKFISVGNEAMVKWATNYYVEPGIVLKWVNYLQNLKQEQKLAKDIWITSSDNFASWGGGEKKYHVNELKELIKTVDFISIHTYPMHDTYYNPDFWGVTSQEIKGDTIKAYNDVMGQAIVYAQNQFKSVQKYTKSIGLSKPIHIGETGWASYSSEMYGKNGTKACDEYKQALYYHKMRAWTEKENISCFFFEAFDEPWKNATDEGNSENHFGLFTVEAKAKYVLWEMLDSGTFTGMKRGENTIEKTYNSNKDSLLKDIKLPVVKNSLMEQKQMLK